VSEGGIAGLEFAVTYNKHARVGGHSNLGKLPEEKVNSSRKRAFSAAGKDDSSRVNERLEVSKSAARLFAVTSGQGGP
jgi:hypothetical protein